MAGLGGLLLWLSSWRSSWRSSRRPSPGSGRRADRLSSMLEERRRRSRTVAHEMTAPIGQLWFALELLREHADPAATTLLAGMHEDLQCLDALVAESLDDARIEATGSADLGDASLSALMRDAVAATARSPGHGRQVTSIDLPDARDRVRCDARQMRRALANLVRNAIRHADSTVVIRAEVDGARTWIHVDDDGPGIPAEQRARLFEPFERGAGSERAARGWGLGLAIVAQVAALHGGMTRIGVSPLGGARVSIGW